MTGRERSTRERFGAIFFAFVMVTSMVAFAGVAFTGSAAAATGSVDNVDHVDGNIEVTISDSDLNADASTAENHFVYISDSGGEQLQGDGTDVKKTGQSTFTIDGAVIDTDGDGDIAADNSQGTGGEEIFFSDSGDGDTVSFSIQPDGSTQVTVSGGTTPGLEAGDSLEIDDTNALAPEAFQVTETGPNTGTFSGTESISTSAGSLGDDTLQSANTNAVTATYVDVSETTSRTGTTNADFAAPSITGASVEVADTDDDGNIDTANIVMSEPIDDSTISASSFSIGGKTADSFDTATKDDDGTDDTGGADNDEFSVSLNDGNEVDGTAAVDVTYTKPNSNPLEDIAGNEIAGDNTIGSGTLSDIARPVLLSAVKGNSANQVNVEFSEGVADDDNDDGNDEAGIEASDFGYASNNGPATGATGISSVSDDGTPSNGKLQLFLDNSLTSGDIGTDTINAENGDPDGIDDQSASDGNAALTNSVVITQATLAGGPVAGTQFEVGGDGSADVVAGSASESLGEIKLRDDSANADAAFAGETKITFPQGVTINTSASTLNTNTVITSQNDGVDVDGVSVTNNDRTITIDHSGTSNNGEEIRIASGSVVLNVDASGLDTTSSSSDLAVELDTFSGTEDISGFLKLKSPTESGNNGVTVAAGAENLASGSGYTDTNEEVVISPGNLDAAIEGTDTSLVGNQTNIVYSLEGDTGVRFDTDNIGSELIQTGLDLDGDGTDEVDESGVTVSAKEVTVPITDPIDAAGTEPTTGITLHNLVFETDGDATNTDLNITLEAPDPSAGSYTIDTDPSSSSPATESNFVTVASPDINLAHSGSVDNLAVGLDQQYTTQSSTNLVTGDNAQIEIVDTSGNQMANGENITIRTNNSAVTFDTSQSVEVVGSDGSTINEDNDGALEVGVDQQSGNSPQIADATIFEDRIEIQTQNADTGVDDRIQLDNVALNVSNTASDDVNVAFEAVTKPGAAAPEVTSATTDDKNDGDSPTNNQFVTLKRPNIESPSSDQSFDAESNSNFTVDLDADGFESREVSGGDNALVVEQSVVGQIADTTNVTIALEDDTGVTFDTSADTAINQNNPGDGTPTVEATVSGGEHIDVTSLTINEKSIDITLEDETSNDDGDNSDGADTQLDSSASIVLDDLILNATSGASNTAISVTTNATVSAPDQADVTDSGGNEGTLTTANNEVTTTLSNTVEINTVEAGSIKLDPDTSAGASNFDPDSFTFGADQQVNKPQVDSSIGAGVKVEDGGSGFGGATVNFEIVETPEGSSGASLNTTQATTNSNGNAFFNFTAGDTAGDYVVNATVESTGAGVNVTYTAQPGAVAGVSVTPIENAIAGDGAETGVAALYVNSTDANGNKVTGSSPTVELAADNVGAADVEAASSFSNSETSVNGLSSGEFSLDSSDGSSVVLVKSSQVEDVTITAEVSGNSDTGTVTFFDQVGGIDLTLNETSAAVDETVTADATLTQEDGTVIEVPDVSVSYDDNGDGNTTFEGGADSDSATTNGSGVASVNVTAEQNGTSTIDASSNLRTDSATLTIEGQATESASVTFNDQSVQNGTEEVTVASANYTLADGSEGDYVVVMHVVNDDGSISNPVGASSDQTGSASDITVDLNDTSATFEDGDALDTLTENTTLRAMLHETSNDSAFGPSLGLATDDADITVTPASPLDGPAGEFDADADGDITVSELGDAGTAFAQGELTIAELGEIGAEFAS